MKFTIVLVLAAIAFCNGASLNKRDLKDTLLARAASLQKQTATAIETLSASGRANLVAELSREEKRVQALAAELQGLSAGAAGLTRLEAELRAAESRLTNELRRIEGRSTGTPRITAEPATTSASIVKRATKEEVIAKAQRIIDAAAAEARRLRSEGKTQEAARIEAEEKKLQQEVTALQSATSPEAIQRIESQISATEQALRPISKRATREQSRLRAREAELRAIAEATRLRTTNPTVASRIDREIKALQVLQAELALTSTTSARAIQIDAEILAIERRLAEEGVIIAARTTAVPSTTASS